MKRGLTVRMPIPALFTSMSMPPSRDHVASTARATEDSCRTSSSMPTAPGSSAGDRGRLRAGPAGQRDRGPGSRQGGGHREA